LSLRKLTREEVIAKYSPTPDPLWTPEVEARFFASLPAASYRQVTTLDDTKAALIQEFAKETLNAKRMAAAYVVALGVILSRFADADDDGTECLISQRDQRIGTPATIRSIQVQMEAVGLLVRLKRAQGHGFVGDVFVYAPRQPLRHRRATPDYLEQSYRACEGEAPYPVAPSNLSHDMVPF
jgi:hypothetical protein